MKSCPWVRLGELVPGVVADWEEQADSPLHKIRQVWKEVVGAKLAAHSSPFALHNNTLLVSVEGSAWKAEFARFHSERTLEVLNKLLGRGTVGQLRFICAGPKLSVSPPEDTHGEA